jgi:hypothetical protein
LSCFSPYWDRHDHIHCHHSPQLSRVKRLVYHRKTTEG